MFGFSRGSYTVRSLAGFMNNSGLVKQENIPKVKEACTIYRNKDICPKHRQSKAFREAYCDRGEYGTRVPIKLLACFDTVGALGLPDASLMGSLLTRIKYKFHDTTLSRKVENAIHVLSIDEARLGFKLILMVENDAVPGQLTQLYFPGHHSGVGGGQPGEEKISNFTLMWLVGEVKRRGLPLSFHREIFEEGYVNLPFTPLPLAERLNNAMMNVAAGDLLQWKGVRTVTTEECHPGVAERYANYGDWRPAALEKVGNDLIELAQQMKAAAIGGNENIARKGRAEDYSFSSPVSQINEEG